jgi:hypothetical protein
MSISLEHHPRADHLMIDWYWPGLTPWTSKTATLLAHQFCMDQRQVIFPGITQSLREKRIALLFTRYILRMKRHYVEELENFDQFDYLQRLLEDETACDDDEVENESEGAVEDIDGQLESEEDYLEDVDP